jgi:hypothetical protein
MRSDKQIQASKTNGALSRGPVTPQGKRNSSRNSTRHGLLAQTVVLEEESADRFQELLAALMDEYQPRTASQVALVEAMAVARWRQSRVWLAQKTAMDRGIAAQHRSVGRNSRAFLALLGSPDSVCQQEVLLRYEIAFERQFNRALANLLALQSLPLTGRTMEKKKLHNEPGQGIEKKWRHPSDCAQNETKTKPDKASEPSYPVSLLTSGEAMVEIKG